MHQEKNISVTKLLVKGFAVLRANGAIGLIKKIYSYLDNSGQNNYQKWIKSYGTYSSHEVYILKQEYYGMKSKPVICLIIFLMKRDIEGLTKTVDSIKKQIYESWSLKVIIQAPLDGQHLKVIKKLCQNDVRIDFEIKEGGPNLIGAVNNSVALNQINWIGFIECGDIITIDALFLMAREIIKQSAMELIYCDSDLVDTKGKRHSPHFKCDWNLDLFYSQLLNINLTLYKSNLIKRLGKYESCELCELKNFCLTLFSLEQINQKNIYHLPRVLYSEKQDRLGLVEDFSLRPNVISVLRSHFSRLRIPVQITSTQKVLHLSYDIPQSNPHVSIVIPTKDKLDILSRCINSILEKTNYKNYDVLIIDNDSIEHDTKNYFLAVQRNNPNIKVIECPGDFNFSKLVNFGCKYASGEVLCLLNNDVEIISKNWLDEMVGHSLRPGIGAVGAKLLYPNATIQHGGVILGLGSSGIAGHFHHGVDGKSPGYFNRAIAVQEISAITAACLVVKKSNYELVGGFDEKNLPVDFNDVDFCLRLLKIGLRNIWTPFSILIHHEHGTRNKHDSKEKISRLKKDINYMRNRWGKCLSNDPFYSPNLSLDSANFLLAFPPRSSDYVKKEKIQLNLGQGY